MKSKAEAQRLLEEAEEMRLDLAFQEAEAAKAAAKRQKEKEKAKREADAAAALLCAEEKSVIEESSRRCATLSCLQESIVGLVADQLQAIRQEEEKRRLEAEAAAIQQRREEEALSAAKEASEIKAREALEAKSLMARRMEEATKKAAIFMANKRGGFLAELSCSIVSQVRERIVFLSRARVWVTSVRFTMGRSSGMMAWAVATQDGFRQQRAATTIKALIRGRLLEVDYIRSLSSAVSIQRCARGMKARRTGYWIAKARKFQRDQELEKELEQEKKSLEAQSYRQEAVRRQRIRDRAAHEAASLAAAVLEAERGQLAVGGSRRVVPRLSCSGMGASGEGQDEEERSLADIPPLEEDALIPAEDEVDEVEPVEPGEEYDGGIRLLPPKELDMETFLLDLAASSQGQVALDHLPDWEDIEAAIASKASVEEASFEEGAPSMITQREISSVDGCVSPGKLPRIGAGSHYRDYLALTPDMGTNIGDYLALTGLHSIQPPCPRPASTKQERKANILRQPRRRSLPDLVTVTGKQGVKGGDQSKLPLKTTPALHEAHHTVDLAGGKGIVPKKKGVTFGAEDVRIEADPPSPRAAGARGDLGPLKGTPCKPVARLSLYQRASLKAGGFLNTGTPGEAGSNAGTPSAGRIDIMTPSRMIVATTAAEAKELEVLKAQEAMIGAQIAELKAEARKEASAARERPWRRRASDGDITTPPVKRAAHGGGFRI